MSGTMLGVILVILCAIIEGAAQVLFKKSTLVVARRKAWVAAGIALFVLQALIYTGALQFIEVSTAFPIGSIGFVIVAVFSQRMLNEPVTGTRWIGVGLILLGVGLLAARA